MKYFRGALFLAISALLSWHVFLRHAETAPAKPTPIPAVEIAVAPETAPAPEPVPEPTPEPQPEPEEEPEKEPVQPPPPERGDPDGDEEAEEVAEPTPEITAEEKARDEIASIQGSQAKVKEAADELSGKTRRGFRTVLYSAAADQLTIARTFGEQIVLVPRKGLDPRRPHYYRLTDGAVEKVNAQPPLADFRQYRDFFAFEYTDLPDALRTLRRKVPVRSDVFLFAALIPPSEWAVVMARRATALKASGREEDTLRRAEMRYVALPGGGYDIQVKQLVFADGSRWKQTP